MVQQQQGELNKALIEAAENGQVEECQRLIQAGANVNATDNDDWTPLLWAAREGHVESCRLLINRGANVNATTNGGRTPLHWAAQQGRVDVCRLLIVRGTNVNVANDYGWTPLHLAVWHGLDSVCRLLLDRMANVNADNGKGSTPLDMAINSDSVEVLAYFYVHGVVNFHQPYRNGRTPWDRLTAQQQGTLTEAMEDHQEKIAILQTRGLPIELARLVMGYL